MKKHKEVILLKLGGSLLTDKEKPFFIREEIVKDTVHQIIKANEKIILIHGGGSFGHPLAQKYHLIKGFDISVPNQIFGLAKTHQAMVRFNSFIVNFFLEQNYSALTLQPSSIFFRNNEKIITTSIDVIETMLDLHILPILYGDIIFDTNGSFSIISGDQIIIKLCEKLRKYQVVKVIFAIEIDGIYIKNKDGKNKKVKLACEVLCSELESLDLADLGEKIDVTGSIRGKINSIKKICNFNIPVQLINGLKENYIFNSLKSKKIKSTNIKVRN